MVPGEIGDTVLVPIPMVDRGRGDARNILGIILDRDLNETYRIGVHAGVIKGRFARNHAVSGL